MLQPPSVLAIVLHVLQGRRAEGKGESLPCWGSLPAQATIYTSFVLHESLWLGTASSVPMGCPLFPFSLLFP